MSTIKRIGYIAINETQRLNSFTRFLTKVQNNKDMNELMSSAYYNPFSWIIHTNKREYAGVNTQKCEGKVSPVSYLPFDSDHIDEVYLSPSLSVEDYKFIKSKNPEIEYFVYSMALDDVVAADKYFKSREARGFD